MAARKNTVHKFRQLARAYVDSFRVSRRQRVQLVFRDVFNELNQHVARRDETQS